MLRIKQTASGLDSNGLLVVFLIGNALVMTKSRKKKFGGRLVRDISNILMKYIPFFLLFIFTPMASAECYLNRIGNPTCPSNDGAFVASFAKGEDEIRRIYIIPMNVEPRCGEFESGQDESIFINNVKVRMFINCPSDSYIHYYPLTKKGQDHLLKQFITKKTVVMKLVNGGRIIFDTSKFNYMVAKAMENYDGL
ncbi:hypothetical protein D6T51_07920 [Salmonella enterica subsp. enterica serovar Muenchen]|nr:hypothetical protein [Salmonella enterica subsp. enterica serovar Muenchen]